MSTGEGSCGSLSETQRGRHLGRNDDLEFRWLLKSHVVSPKILRAVTADLAASMLVDATISRDPSSTKNSPCERRPKMHRTKKGKPWYFGTKAHRYGRHLGLHRLVSQGCTQAKMLEFAKIEDVGVAALMNLQKQGYA